MFIYSYIHKKRGSMQEIVGTLFIIIFVLWLLLGPMLNVGKSSKTLMNTQTSVVQRENTAIKPTN